MVYVFGILHDFGKKKTIERKSIDVNLYLLRDYQIWVDFNDYDPCSYKENANISENITIYKHLFESTKGPSIMGLVQTQLHSYMTYLRAVLNASLNMII